MELASRALWQQPSAWNSLLWKDFQQVKSTLLAVLLCSLSLQLIFLAIAWVNTRARESLLGSAALVACVTPILLAVGCSGMLIGQERQSGTWAWSSSLPVSWQRALTSKLLVSLLGSLFVGGILAITPLVLLASGLLPAQDASLVAIYASGMTAIAFFEVLVFGYLASLLARETLTALVVAGLGLLIGQFFLSIVLMDVLQSSLTQLGYARETTAQIGMSLIAGAVLLGGLLAMVFAFRWRWGVGQNAALLKRSQAKVAVLPAAHRFQYTSETPPGEWRALTRLSLSNSWVLRLTLLLAGGALAAFIPSSEFHFVLAVVFAGLMGLSSFEGDQTLQRFRFLADRGVNVRRLVSSRLLASAGWAVASVAIILAFMTSMIRVGRIERLSLTAANHVISLIALCLLAFLVAALASLCLRKTIIAATATFVVCIAALVITVQIIDVAAVGLGAMLAGELAVLRGMASMWSIPSIIILPIAIFRLARRWIVEDHPSLPKHFAWISVCVLMLPIFLTVNTLFLAVPRVPWRGTPTTQLAQQPRRAVDRSLSSEPLLSNALVNLDQLVVTNDDYRDATSQAIQNMSRELAAAAQVGSDFSGDSRGLLDPPPPEQARQIQGLVERLQKGLDAQPTVTMDSRGADRLMSNLIVRTAALAAIALRNSDGQSALARWRMNRRLQEMAQSSDPLASAAARNLAMSMLASLSDKETRMLGDDATLSGLVPSPANEKSAGLEQSRIWATRRGKHCEATSPPTGNLNSWFVTCRGS